MRKILLMIPCMVLALLVLFPAEVRAAEYNGVEYGSITKFSTDLGFYYNTDPPGYVLKHHDYVLCSSNPDSKICVLTADIPTSETSFVTYGWYFSVGGDTTVTVYDNGELWYERDILEIDMDVINSNLLNNVSGDDDLLANTIVLFRNINGWSTDKPEGKPEFYDVGGYLYNMPYDINVGVPTYATIKYIVENMESLKHQEEVYDSSLPVPDLVSFRDTKSSLIRVSNYNDYKVEYKIKLYGPSHIYFKSENLINISFDISGEFPSSFYKYRLPDTSILRIGSNHGNNFSGYSHVYYDCMSDFKDFCKSCSDEVIFEYENAAVGALVGKFYYRDYISYANYDFYDYEIYARFLDDSGQDILYGDWTHLVIRRDGSSSSGSGGSGNDEPVEDEDNRNNEDLIPDIPDFSNFENFDASNLWDFISSLANSLGQVPTIVSQIFGFMPSWVLYMIGIGIAAIVILRFLGR